MNFFAKIRHINSDEWGVRISLLWGIFTYQRVGCITILEFIHSGVLSRVRVGDNITINVFGFTPYVRVRNKVQLFGVFNYGEDDASKRF